MVFFGFVAKLRIFEKMDGCFKKKGWKTRGGGKG